MEGMERIRESILEEAKEQAENVIKEAQLGAATIEEQAVKKAEENTRNRLLKAEDEAEEAQRRMLSMAELDLKKQALGVKQSLIDRAFDKALERLNSLPEEEYADMVVSALESADLKGGEELIVPEKDRVKFREGLLKKVNEELGFELKLSEEVRAMQGGFIVKANGVEINNSFETLLRMEREKIETEIAQILFQQ